METLINNVDAIVLGFVQGSFGSLSGPVQSLWNLMFTIFIAFYGYKAMISGRFAVSDLFAHCVKIILILMLATQWDLFSLFIFDLVTGMPADIAGKLMQAASSIMGASSTDVQSANTALGDYFDRGMQASANILQGAGWRDIGQYLYALAIWVGTIGTTGYAAMLIILAKLALAVLMALGPLFILLLIFANTKSLFDGWLRTLLNYALVPVFVYALLSVLLVLAQTPLEQLESKTGADELISVTGPYLLINFIATLLLAQILNIAASVTGGVSLSTMGLAAYTRRATLIPARWSWQKSAPVRSHIGKKVGNGMKKAGQSGKSILSAALQKRQEVR